MKKLQILFIILNFGSLLLAQKEYKYKKLNLPEDSYITIQNDSLYYHGSFDDEKIEGRRYPYISLCLSKDNSNQLAQLFKKLMQKRGNEYWESACRVDDGWQECIIVKNKGITKKIWVDNYIDYTLNEIDKIINQNLHQYKLLHPEMAEIETYEYEYYDKCFKEFIEQENGCKKRVIWKGYEKPKCPSTFFEGDLWCF